jgi:Tol biopolymer transport system component
VEMIVIAARAGPNREVAFRHVPPSGSEEVWVWPGIGYRIERASAAGRVVRSYHWSADGQWLVVAYRPTPLLPASIELVELDAGARLSFSPPGVHGADLSFNNEWLAMSVAVAGRQEIAVMRIDGTDLRQLTAGAESAVIPRWAPDGRQIAYLRTTDPEASIGELWLMSPDGASQTRVAPRARNVAWSPDAKQLAFDDGDRVWLMQRDGSGLVAVSPAPNAALSTENGRPRWSSDARRLVHSYSGEVRVLTSNGSLLTTQVIDASVKHPDFSPDGQFLVFATSNGLRIGPSSIGALRYYISYNNVEPFPLWRP